MKKAAAFLLAACAAGLVSAQEIHFGIGARGQFGFGLGSSSNVAESYDTSKHDASVDGWQDYYKSKGWDWDAKDWDYDDYYDDRKLSVKPFESILAGGALIGRISFDSVPGLYLQPEIGYSHNQVKYKYSWEGSETIDAFTWNGKSYTSKDEYEAEGDGSMSYSSIDIPIIVGYDFELGHGMFVGPYGGLSLSIPVGSLSWNRGAQTTTVRSTFPEIDSNLEVSMKTSTTTKKGNSTTLSGKIKNGVIPGLVLGGSFGYKFDQHNMILTDLRYQLDFVPVKAEIDYKDAALADWNSTDNKGASYTWTEWEDKWWGGKTFNIDAFTRRALNIGVSYVYFF
ncbi:MAG: hypothetical protein II837_14875 [Treponema sp.]|nr:hypothetical protein [Treponema sp.]